MPKTIKDISTCIFNFNPATKASEVVDFLGKNGIVTSEHTVRAFKAKVTLGRTI